MNIIHKGLETVIEVLKTWFLGSWDDKRQVDIVREVSYRSV
jgi:hypothetical protein